MKFILKQAVRLLAALVVLYIALLAVTLLLVPRADFAQRLDTGRSRDSLFLTEPKYVFMARSRLNTTADKVLLLGASNMVVGFRQTRVQALVPGKEVHNLSVGGSNITQISQIVDLVREVQTPEARRHNTYVIGLWYGIFANDKARWFTPDRHAGDTDVDIERYRYGFYRRTDAGAAPVLPPRFLDLGVLLVHPYLVLDGAARDLTKSLRDAMAAKPPAVTDEQRNAVVLNEAEKSKYLAFWLDYMGLAQSLEDESFQVLEKMVSGILAEGGRVVIVDMPIPPWHARGSVLAADYRKHMDKLRARWQTRPGIAMLNMADVAADADFSDEVHPKPRVTESWAQLLAKVLNATPG